MAYLEITLKVSVANRSSAAGVYGFASVADANAYLKSDLFTQDVVNELQPYFDGAPEVRIYDAA